MRSVIDFLASNQAPTLTKPFSQAPSGWFFHVDAKNVVIPWWNVQPEDNTVRLRIVETEGRKSKTKLQAFRSFTSARVVDAFGNTLREAQLEDGIVELSMEPYSFQEVELQW